MQIRGYAQFGGEHHETATMRHVLAHWGVVAPHSGQPISEAMLFGLGIGIAFRHFNYTIARQPYFMLLPRVLGNCAATVGERLGLTLHTHETGSAKFALEQFKAALDAGDPLIVWGDLANTPYMAMPIELAGTMRHLFVAYGYDDDGVLVADRASVPLRLSWEELAATRRRISYFKQRLTVVEPPDELTTEQLATAIKAAVRATCGEMLTARGTSAGLAGLEQWARFLTGSKNKQAWPKLYADRHLLFDALQSTHWCAEARGTGGGAFRHLYADFLSEAAILTGNPGYNDAAAIYQQLAGQWCDLVDAASPDDISILAETRRLLMRRKTIFEQCGQEALPEMQQIGDRLWQLRGDFAASELPQARIDDLLADMSQRVLQIHAVEADAVRLLALLAGY